MKSQKKQSIQNSDSSHTFVLGIAGGSGSGKSTVVNALLEGLGPDLVSVLQHDAYYHSRPDMSYEERFRINFDHPDALDTELMASHLAHLLAGHSIEMPIYDFTRHLRSSHTKTLYPKQILIVDGILVLHEVDLRKHMDLKVYVLTFRVPIIKQPPQ